MGARGDLILLRQSMRWKTSKLRETMLENLDQDLASNDPRIRNAARKIVIAMEAQNQKDQHKVIDVRVSTQHDQLDGIAADLGIEASVIEDAAREAGAITGDSEGEGT